MSPAQLKPLVLLSMLMLFIMVSGTALAHIIIKLFGVWSITCSSLIFPLSFAINVIIAECYKKEITFFVFITSIILSVTFSFVASDSIPLSIPFALWGTLGSLVGLTVNTLIVSLPHIGKVRSFIMRYLLSTTLGELLLVTITTWGTFLAHYDVKTVMQIWLFSYLSKVVITLILAFPIQSIAIYISSHYELRTTKN